MIDIEEIREIFEHFDDDQNGRIDNGEIDFNEFFKWWLNR